ncbi:PqqD family protein [Lactobacillus sp. CC-MHH1034]|uniref:PqqD family protein n=1 Tax=Agrilactobacillus fermenti TaxID=2586909 RepID=UPI001E45F55D|nr:PqqD family protein [Agrilactobacillus fermenti]MCD2257443.1 PqqD family protein [Agrilactobacillus fermenti]
MRKIAHEYILIGKNSSLMFNNSALIVWQKLSKQTSSDELKLMLEDKYPEIDSERIQNDLQNLLEYMVNKKIIKKVKG